MLVSPIKNLNKEIAMKMKLKIKKKIKIPEETKVEEVKKISFFKMPKIVKKQGRWCEYYSGRVPYPIECSTNIKHPRVVDHPNCVTCKRKVSYRAWRNNIWDNIFERVSKDRQDLTDWPSPEDIMKDKDRY